MRIYFSASLLVNTVCTEVYKTLKGYNINKCGLKFCFAFVVIYSNYTEVLTKIVLEIVPEYNQCPTSFLEKVLLCQLNVCLPYQAELTVVHCELFKHNALNLRFLKN